MRVRVQLAGWKKRSLVLTEIIRIILAIFTSYRLASLIALEEGPYIGWPYTPYQIGIFQILRIEAGAYDRDEETEEGKSNLARGLACPLCVGVYISFIVAFLFIFPTTVGDFFLLWMGIAGAQTFLESIGK